MRSVEIENPIESLKNTIPFSVMDWGTEKRNAWVYGIVCGWDENCFQEFNMKFGWDKDTWNRLKRLHDSFDRLEELCQAKRENRVVALPCKYGDTIYHTFGSAIVPAIVKRFIFANPDCYMVEVIGGRCFYDSEYEKTWFTSPEAAEQALREREGQEHDGD